ncbi:MAG: succinate dehydrogenase [Actinomycetota bacterium]|nr:succinate dehydrogenase [Actinomycetota bacterium]
MGLDLRTVRTPADAKRSATSSWELWSWFFMRISGLLLTILVLVHLTIMLVISGGIDRVNFAFVSGRWSSAFWQLWDWTILFLGLLHGTNGIKIVINDYSTTPGKRIALKSFVYTLAFILLLLGSLVILTFDPSKAIR